MAKFIACSCRFFWHFVKLATIICKYLILEACAVSCYKCCLVFKLCNSIKFNVSFSCFNIFFQWILIIRARWAVFSFWPIYEVFISIINCRIYWQFIRTSIIDCVSHINSIICTANYIVGYYYLVFENWVNINYFFVVTFNFYWRIKFNIITFFILPFLQNIAFIFEDMTWIRNWFSIKNDLFLNLFCCIFVSYCVIIEMILIDSLFWRYYIGIT